MRDFYFSVLDDFPDNGKLASYFPRTDQDSVEVFFFDDSSDDRIFSGISIFNKRQVDPLQNRSNFPSFSGQTEKTEEAPTKSFTFAGSDADTTYTVKVVTVYSTLERDLLQVTLVLNGRAIAVIQKKLKAVPVKVQMDVYGAVRETCYCSH